MRAQNVAKWVAMDIHARSRKVKRYHPGVKACKEGDYTNSMYFYTHLVAKYMRLPNFGKTAKIYNLLGMLSWDPIAPI